jgi:hypothetical protein
VVAPIASGLINGPFPEQDQYWAGWTSSGLDLLSQLVLT